ncbi:olfactory receptor 51G1-like [Lutra lutra]|uniref:olfactory receptor 51G1-like n=1 Tax=Lutra lutra TaxID=9657 RepID=UPI001FD467F4|nr:olfactory receptor 51G1-like [Lutra lutra]
MATWDTLLTGSNSSTKQFVSFYLTGIPGYENVNHFISIPFCVCYLIGIVGNCTILHIIHTDKSLHEPMYYFLAMLSLTDMGMSFSTLPTVLKILWFDAREIEVNACVAQMYFIHTFSLMESAVLLAMAFDRYVAICDPLRYCSKLTPQRIIYIGIFIIIRCSIVLPVILVRIPTFPFCHSHVLSHSFCLHQEVIQLACADISFNILYGLFVVAFYWGVDSLGILLSYAFILHSVLGIASQRGKLKALNTCASHICAVLILYVPMIGLSLVHRFAKHSSPIVHITMANIYLLVPPVLNPVIYSVKTNQIRQGFLRILAPKRTRISNTMEEFSGTVKKISYQAIRSD